MPYSQTRHWTPLGVDPDEEHAAALRGNRQLLEASQKGDCAAVLSAIEAGVDVNGAGLSLWTPLHRACERGHAAVVQALVRVRRLHPRVRLDAVFQLAASGSSCVFFLCIRWIMAPIRTRGQLRA